MREKSKSVKRSPRTVLAEALTVIFASALFGISMNAFLVHPGLIIGGATGIATVVNYLFHVPIGIIVIAVNLPLLIINVRQSGIRSMMKTIIGTVVSSVAIDVFSFIPAMSDDMLLCALAGGGGMGVGAGIMFIRGFTTGGGDLCASMINRRAPRFSPGRLILIIDATIIVAASIVMQKYEILIYCLAASASYGLAVDFVINGAFVCRSVFIISDMHEEIADRIIHELDRGVTVLEGEGWYTKEPRKVLLCVVRRREEFSLRKLVAEIDPNAFIILSSGAKVIGHGFERER